jgi:putative membrane protein
MSPSRQVFNRKVRGGLIALVGFALLAAHPARAQASHPNAPTPGPQPVGMSSAGGNVTQDRNDPGLMADQVFVREALQHSMAEVQLGQLALQKSSNDDVKRFAQKMIEDHTKLSDQINQVAVQMKVKAPDSPSKKDKSAIARLQAMNGDDFDKAYIKDMVKDHEQDEKSFRQEAQNTINPLLKNVVVQGAQAIDEHLHMIQQIAQKNNVVASK